MYQINEPAINDTVRHRIVSINCNVGPLAIYERSSLRIEFPEYKVMSLNREFIISYNRKIDSHDVLSFFTEKFNDLLWCQSKLFSWHGIIQHLEWNGLFYQSVFPVFYFQIQFNKKRHI